MTDQPATLSPTQQQIVVELQQLFSTHTLADIHCAMVCVYVQMAFMCARTPRDAKVLVNQMTNDMKMALVNNMPKSKPQIVMPMPEMKQ